MIKKYFVLLFFFFLTIGHAQSPEKFTYQSIIKTSAGYLLKNQDVGLKISVLFNSSNGIAVYSEEHTVESNNNGLVTLIIGEGVSSDVFSDIDWGGGEFFLKVEVDPEGGINYTMNQTSQLLSVPYALYAENSSVNLSVIGQSYITYSGNQISANKIDASNDITGLSNVGISGDYADLTNTPTLFDGDYTSLANKPTLFDGDYANLTNTPTLFDGDYANLTNTPTLFDGDYTSLTNKPTLFDGDYANLTNTPTLFDGDYTSLTNKPTLFDGDYANLTNTPTLFDGDYTSLANKPTLFDGDYANLTNTPTLFDGDYTSLTNKPTLFDGDYANLTNTPTLFDGDYTSLANKPTLFDGDYANLTNTPTLFDGDYTSLANKPTLFDGDYANLTNTPTLFDGDYTSLTNKPTLFDGDYANLTNTPTLFDGDYTSLANKPTLFDGDYANLTNTPTLFDGDYTSLTNNPELDDGKIYMGDSNNKSAQITVSGDVTLANTGAVTIADDAVTTAKLANIAQGSILVGGASDAPTVYDAKTEGQILVGDGTDIASVAVSGDVTLAKTGAVTIADDAVTTAKLANIAQGSILVGGASDAPTVYDAKTEGQILVGDGTDIASVAVSGDVTLAKTGAVTIADDAVTTAKLANIAQGSILVGGASDAPTVYDAKTEGQILVGDGTDIASVAVSGDVTLAKTGAVTIADDAVTTAKLANIAQGSILVGGASDAPTVYDAKTEGQILVGDGTDIASVAVSGDVTLAKTGAVTIADDAVNLTTKVSGVLPIANGGTGASSASSVRAAIGLLSGAFTTTSQNTEQTTLNVGVNINSIVVAGFRTNGGNEKMLSAVPNSDGTITFRLSNLNAVGDIIHWIAINP